MSAITAETPILDLRECMPPSHPREFFELMDELKPYLVLCIAEDEALIKLLGKSYNLEDFRERMVKLANLGYTTNTSLELKTSWSGAIQYLEFEPVRIRWNKDSNYIKQGEES